ncbi:hypothetical protein P4S72_01255 [Vibrio sp. PP-XX7]
MGHPFETEKILVPKLGNVTVAEHGSGFAGIRGCLESEFSAVSLPLLRNSIQPSLQMCTGRSAFNKKHTGVGEMPRVARPC